MQSSIGLKDRFAFASDTGRDRHGIVVALLPAEITARKGRDPGEIYWELEREFVETAYDPAGTPAATEEKTILAKISPHRIQSTELAGGKIQSLLTEATGNGAAIGGLKVTATGGWFAARPSGAEDIYKIYAGNFRGADHLRRIVAEAKTIAGAALAMPTDQPEIASRTNPKERP